MRFMVKQDFSPFVVGCSIKAHLVAAAMHIVDSAFGKSLRGDGHPGVCSAGQGVHGDLTDVFFSFQFLQAVRIAAMIGKILINSVPHDEEGAAKIGFFGADQRFLEAGHGHGGQDADDGDHNHHLDQGVALSVFHHCMARYVGVGPTVHGCATLCMGHG